MCAFSGVLCLATGLVMATQEGWSGTPSNRSQKMAPSERFSFGYVDTKGWILKPDLNSDFGAPMHNSLLLLI